MEINKENEMNEEIKNISENKETNDENIKIENEQNENKTEVNKDEKKKEKRRGIIFNIIAIICITVFCFAMSPKTLQNDTFYTITIGEYLYNNGISDLTQDLYSWHELPYTYPHWLYDLGMFIVYDNFGQAGIYASTMIFSALLGISIYVLCNYKSKNKVISFITTIGSIYLIESFIAARAQLVTFILFIWTVFFIEKLLETKKKRYAIMLILIPLLIANLHCAVFPFYFVLFLPYIAEYFVLAIEDFNIIYRIRKKMLKIKKKFAKTEEARKVIDEKIDKLVEIKEDRNRKVQKLRENPYKIKATKNYVAILLIAIMGIAAVTGFLNPAGDGAYTYLYKIMQGNTTGSINEHLPLTLADNVEFAIAIVVLLLVLIFTDTKIKLSDLFMLMGITFLSFKSRRQVSMFAILCMPILAYLIAQMVEKYDKKSFIKLENFFTGWFGATVIICLFIIWSTNIIKPNMSANYIDTASYPVEASDWILDNLDVENMKLYNEYNYGAYLLYRGIPVFIDSRCDLYTPEFNGTYNKEEKRYEGKDIFTDALNIAGLGTDYKEKFDEYGVTHVMLYENNKLAMVLETDSNYKKIYEDDNFKIFEKLDTLQNQK